MPGTPLPVAGDEGGLDTFKPEPERITIDELRRLQQSGEPVIVADVRTERSYRDDPLIAVGAIRLPPDDAVRLARERRLDQHATLVLYCA
jgi:rhodanese-related sulfurtransferase